MCTFSSSLIALGVLAAPSTASAQYRPRRRRGRVGEDYHIEAAYSWWDAEPSLIVNSESLGIIGTDVDLITDLGIEKKRLGKFDLVLRPAKKHRFKFQRTADQIRGRRVPGAARVRVQRPALHGRPAGDDDAWTSRPISFGYEYDFLYFTRGFFGAKLDLKYTNIDVDAARARSARSSSAQAAPIPAVGFAGRGYITPNFAVDGEFTFFRIPDNLEEQLDGDGSYTDFDVHATYNFNKYVGAQLGWRKTTIFYEVEFDTGDLKFTGLYFGGVVRY